jgi:plasmid stabilization system protein ParE
VAEVVYSPRALDDFERVFEFLAQHDPATAVAAVTAVQTAVLALADHPFLGRRVRGEIRKLIISYGRTGFVALYRFVPSKSEIRVLTIQHQRELDFRD